jgi:hypothetical protein
MVDINGESLSAIFNELKGCEEQLRHLERGIFDKIGGPEVRLSLYPHCTAVPAPAPCAGNTPEISGQSVKSEMPWFWQPFALP